MRMIPSRLAAHAALALAAAASAASAVRADPASSQRPDAAVARAFGQLPEEASTAYGDLCREKKPGNRGGASTDFMPDCASLLTRRLNEAAKAPKGAAAPVEPVAEAASPRPAEAKEPLPRLPDLPAPVAAPALSPETVALVGSEDVEAAELETAAPTEVTAIDVERPSAEAARKSRAAPAARPANRQAEPTRRSGRTKPQQARKDQEPPRSAEAPTAPRDAAGGKDPWEDLRASTPGDARAAAPAPQPAAEARKAPTLREFAAKLMAPFRRAPQPAPQPTQPPAAAAAQPAEQR